MPLIVGIVSPKGGSGKTTTAVHLARAIQETGDNVVILDTDPQGSAYAWTTKHAIRAGSCPSCKPTQTT